MRALVFPLPTLLALAACSSSESSPADSSTTTNSSGSSATAAGDASSTAASSAPGVASSTTDSSSSGAVETIPRRDVLESLATLVIVPTHRELAAQAATLAEATAAVCDQPDAATLAEAQQAWRTTRRWFRLGTPYALGPLVEQRIDSNLDFWPVRVNAVDATLAAREEPTAEYVEDLGVATKGLPVIEYLLFDPEQQNAGVLEALQEPKGVGDHRCAFVAALAADVATQTELLSTAWGPEAGNYAAEFAAAGQMSFDDLVNETVFTVEGIADTKLGKPLGLGTGGDPQPDASESRFSDNAWADIAADLAGVGTVYLGAGKGLGLTDLVVALAPDLDASIRDQLSITQAAVSKASTGAPLRVAVIDDAASVEKVYEDVFELQRLLTIDMAGVLGVTITLNDNDGD